MRLNRTVAGVAAAALIGLVPISLASSPAQAADNTTVTSLSASKNVLQYKSGYSPYLTASVKTSGGSSVYAGSVNLFASTAGGAWTKIRTENAGGYVSFDVTPQMNTLYRVTYSGGSEYGDSYQASASGTLAIRVYRKLTVKNPKSTLIKGKVAPKYAKKKIVIKKKVGKKWKKLRTLKTNKRSRFSVKLPSSRKRMFFQIIVPGNKQFTASVVKGSTIRY